MLASILIVIFVTALTAFTSMAGGLLLLSGSKLAKFFEKYGAIIAAIILLYAVFGDIIPEILEDGSLPVYRVAWLVIVSTAICSIVSFIAGHFHKHGEHKKIKSKAQAYAMFVVDILHTILDGIVLGVAFSASIPLGVTTALATVAHEIPQELGDFSIMLRSGMKKRHIIKLQSITAITLIPVTLIAFFVGDALKPALPTMLCFVAGGLLYIALGEIMDIFTDLWKRAKKGTISKK